MKRLRGPEADLENIIPLLINTWRRFHKQAGPPDRLQTREFRSVVAAIKILQDKKEHGKSLIGQDYFAKRELLSSYILYQWIIHYQEGLSLIGELPRTPRRVLDICSGPAAFAFAALRHGATEVFATDRNVDALQLGAEIAGRYGMPMNVRHWDCLKGPMPIEGKFDLIIVGHCLEELFPAELPKSIEKQQAFLQMLLKRLTPQGHLLIVDSSANETNKRILQIRDTCVEAGVPVQAPCVWRGACPALQTTNSPCYAQRELEKPHLIKEIQRASQINLSSLKMSYVIFCSPEAQWPKLPELPLYRVISPPVESYQGKRFYLCGTDGKKNLGSRLKELPPESRAFDFLRRGVLIGIEDALASQHSLDIIEGTKITVEAACGKPLNEQE